MAEDTKQETIEESSQFLPQFSLEVEGQNLIPVIVQEQSTGMVLMFAYMNREALQLTIDSKEAVFYSRSRKTLWRKGETSGNVLRVHSIRCDCDQDTLLLFVSIENNGLACHTQRKSCFYRTVHKNDEKDATHKTYTLHFLE